MSNFVYSPSEVEITFELPIPLPGILEAGFNVEDFINVTISPQIKYSTKTGIFGEPSINAKRTNKAVVTIETAHGSDDNVNLFSLYDAQSYGAIGLPMFINHYKEVGDSNLRPNFTCPVAVLQGLPAFGMGTKGKTRIYTFEVPHLTTIYK